RRVCVVRSCVGRAVSPVQNTLSERHFTRFVGRPKFAPNMKQNSPKPTSGAPSSAPNRTQMQHRGPAHHHHHQQQQQQQQHHHHQMPIHYQQIQPAAFPQQPSVQQAQGCIVLPQHTYRPPVQLSSVECSAMVPPNSQQATSSPASFSTSAQPAPGQYVQTSQHQRLPQMPQVQLQPAHYQPPVVDFVTGGSGGTTTGAFSGAHQPYKQQQQYQPMPSYPVAQPAQLPAYMEPSAHPEGSTSDAQYFFGK
uniref:Uncharacterized protein n=1 Tax=Anopheles dirus TaxID=7168 RepID=A0A182NFW7_9DIPT